MVINKRVIRLVIFDMDGLMFGTERLAGMAWEFVLTENGYKFDNKLFEETIGLTGGKTGELYEKYYGSRFPYQKIVKEAGEVLNNMVEADGVPVKDGLYDLLDCLDDLKIKKALATSTARKRAEMLLGKADVINRFDCIVCGDEVMNGKPDPEIFLRTAEKSLESPCSCAVLEDSENGITAAFRAGMAPIMVPDIKDPGAEVAAMACRIFKNLDEVRMFFKQSAEEI
jgi:HAD superfamily hydrolase (TIGR01509 family)